MLCEGQDDVAVVRVLLERLDCDPDSRSISIVDCGGRENLPDYIRLLHEFHIPVLAVSDVDATKAANNAKVAEDVKKVAEAAGHRAVVFTEDLETALGTTKQGSNTAHVVELAEAIDMDNAPQEIHPSSQRFAASAYGRRSRGLLRRTTMIASPDAHRGLGRFTFVRGQRKTAAPGRVSAPSRAWFGGRDDVCEEPG